VRRCEVEAGLSWRPKKRGREDDIKASKMAPGGDVARENQTKLKGNSMTFRAGWM
jgi:hypothetical protein